jgi:hypothetical protein
VTQEGNTFSNSSAIKPPELKSSRKPSFHLKVTPLIFFNICSGLSMSFISVFNLISEESDQDPPVGLPALFVDNCN